jgi:hypothetical protein
MRHGDLRIDDDAVSGFLDGRFHGKRPHQTITGFLAA